jgi:hypothetical protein
MIFSIRVDGFDSNRGGGTGRKEGVGNVVEEIKHHDTKRIMHSSPP